MQLIDWDDLRDASAGIAWADRELICQPYRLSDARWRVEHGLAVDPEVIEETAELVREALGDD